PGAALREVPASGAGARVVQRRARSGIRLDEGARRPAARRVRGGDSPRRDARVREALPAQLRRLPVPLLQRPHARLGPDPRHPLTPTNERPTTHREDAETAKFFLGAVRCGATRRCRPVPDQKKTFAPFATSRWIWSCPFPFPRLPDSQLNRIVG